MPQKPEDDARAPGSGLDVRSLRDLVAASAAAAPPIAIDRPYAEALRNSVDWLWQTDADFNLTYVSRPLDRSLKWPGESWLGRSLLSLAESEADEATPSPLLVALRERRAFRDCAVEWTSETEQRVRFRLTGLPFEEESSGKFAGFRGTASATSEPAEETQTARELLDLLKAALSERDELQQQLAEIEDDSLKERLAGIAHELRTPLNAIIGFSELIRDQAFGDDPRRYSEYGGNIYRSGVKLLQLVNRILDTAEHESDIQTIEARPFDVEAVVRMTIEVLADSAAAAQVQLYLDVADDLPRALGDRQMTRQILFHLMSRILQDAPAGWTAGIRVQRGAAGRDGGEEAPQGGVRAIVWDGPAAEAIGERSAPGESKAAAPHGTTEAPQVPDTSESGAAQDPADLGPVVLQHLAEIMGAELVVTGVAGQGSEAHLRLPPAPEAPSG
ncbi:MAG: HAMP domain-containing sensor histidine kinase [Kiloniellales bacterium]|nr:HAMP domain-containing sensor histidine kinase [Kiloniellales bacterium]